MTLKAIGLVCKDLSKTQEFYALFGLEFQEAGSLNHLEANLDCGMRLIRRT